METIRGGAQIWIVQSGTLEKYNYCPLFRTHITNDYMVRNYYYYYYDDGDDCDCDLWVAEKPARDM